MKAKLVLAMAFALMLGGRAPGQGNAREASPKQTSDRTRALAFLRAHVIGKTVVSPETVLKYAGDRVEGVSSGSDSFTNLVETPGGFQFDMIGVTKLTNYDLDREGKRVTPGRNEDATYLMRYELTERKSTGKLVGTTRIISSTHSTFAAGLTGAVLMAVEEAGLTTTEHSLFYEDFFETQGKWKAGAAETRVWFALDQGKLVVRGEALQFDVDPQTLKKTRTADPPMKWTSKQLD